MFDINGERSEKTGAGKSVYIRSEQARRLRYTDTTGHPGEILRTI